LEFLLDRLLKGDDPIGFDFFCFCGML